MGLPIADRITGPPRAYWDTWIERFRIPVTGNSDAATARACNLLLHVALTFRAITRGPREISPDWFIYVTDRLLAIARAARGHSVNHALVHLIADMHRCLPSVSTYTFFPVPTHILT